MTSCISTMNVIAQDKKSFTLEDLMPGGNNYFNLQPKNLHGLKWWGDVCVNADIEEVKAVNPTNGKETVLFTLQDTNDLLAAKELGKMITLISSFSINRLIASLSSSFISA